MKYENIQCRYGTKTNDCCNEKINIVKRRMVGTFLMVISVIILTISFIMLTVGDDNIAKEVSYSSTVSSIILSVIAIFMSISGENKTDLIRGQLYDIVSRLEDTTTKVENVNNTRSYEINEYISSLGEIKNNLLPLIETMGEVKNSTFETQKTLNSLVFSENDTYTTRSDMSNEFILQMYRKYTQRYKDQKLPFELSMFLLTTIYSIDNDSQVFLDEFQKYVAEVLNVELNEVIIGVVWGQTRSFAVLDIMNNNEALKLINDEILSSCELKLDRSIALNFHNDYIEKNNNK